MDWKYHKILQFKGKKGHFLQISLQHTIQTSHFHLKKKNTGNVYLMETAMENSLDLCFIKDSSLNLSSGILVVERESLSGGCKDQRLG